MNLDLVQGRVNVHVERFLNGKLSIVSIAVERVQDSVPDFLFDTLLDHRKRFSEYDRNKHPSNETCMVIYLDNK
jgi:hypothetical protein